MVSTTTRARHKQHPEARIFDLTVSTSSTQGHCARGIETTAALIRTLNPLFVCGNDPEELKWMPLLRTP